MWAGVQKVKLRGNDERQALTDGAEMPNSIGKASASGWRASTGWGWGLGLDLPTGLAESESEGGGRTSEDGRHSLSRVMSSQNSSIAQSVNLVLVMLVWGSPRSCLP